MKKLFSLLLFFFITAAFLSAQVVDSTAASNTTAFNELMAWLKSLWIDHKATLFILGFAALSEWLGNTGKVKEGSVLAFILNFIGKFIGKTFFQTKKAKFMTEAEIKKATSVIPAILILLFLGFGSLCRAQEISIGKPIPQDYFTANAEKSLTLKNSFIAARLGIGVMGVSYGKNKETGLYEPIPLSAVGAGLGLLHYKNVAGVPFNDYGFQVLVLQNTQQAGLGLGGYLTYNFGLADNLAPINIGAHYDFTQKQVFVDTGVTFHF